MLKILCLGAGAVGGYFFGRLAESGAADVTFLVREGRKRQLDAGGLRIDSPLGNAVVPVNAITDAAGLSSPPDIVVLTCKAYDLASAIAAVQPAIAPTTTILPLLNGLSHMDVLNATFGRERVLGGLASLHVTMLADGTIKHSGNWRFITFGEQDASSSDRVAALKRAFDGAKGVSANAVTDVSQKMWDKLVMLGTLAGMTTLMRASVGEIVRAGGAPVSLAMLERNSLISEKSGFPVSPELLAGYRKLFADPTAELTASMLRDMERGGPVEADHIVGHLVNLARRHGIPDELHTAALANLKVYEQKRAPKA